MIRTLMKTMSLANHMETIQSYLNVYKVASKSNRHEISATCSKYIIMSCWRRMYWWAGHRSTHELIYGLVDLIPKLEVLVSNHKWGEPVWDCTLDGYLSAISCREDFLVLPHLQNQSISSNEHCKISHEIIDDCHMMLCVQHWLSLHELQGHCHSLSPLRL